MIIDILSPIPYNENMILVGIGKESERNALFKRTMDTYRELNKMPPTLVGLGHEESGKPKVLGADIEISLSHSGEYLVIALSSGPIGIDIQENRALDYEKICARYGINASDVNDFYTKFTLSEASAKQTGKGLAPSLHHSNEIVGKTYHFIKGYTLSIVGDGEAVFVIL